MATVALRKFTSIEWIAEDRNRVLLHVLFWSFLYIDEVLAIFGFTEKTGVNAFTIWFFLFIDMCTVYFNLYVLIPAYLLTNKIGNYIAFTIISILINIEMLFLLRFELACVDCPADLGDQGVVNMLIQDFASTSFILGAAIGANILRRFVMSQKRIQKLETAKLKTELDFLKNQINPHFLFNSLNNIYVQTRKRPVDASESILVLSDMLRYQLYDCAKETVKLNDEIEYLKNYLEMDKMRKNNTEVSVEVKGDPSNVKIAPFIFIPFVENAVVHGIDVEDQSFIQIVFDISHDKLHFTIRNSIPKNKPNKRAGGIGLNNVKRRLELLYPFSHKLNISNTEKEYRVELEVPLKVVGEKQL
jgi:sensor histidine kinase YesM